MPRANASLVVLVALASAAACGTSGSSNPAGAPHGAGSGSGAAQGDDAAPPADDSSSAGSDSGSGSGSGTGAGGDDGTTEAGAGPTEAGAPGDGAPPVATDAGPTSTLPPVKGDGTSGSFMVTTQMSTGPGGNYTLYYPTSIATDGYLHPSLVWGNGALATPSNYTTLLDTIASNGFVIIEYNATPNGQQMIDAIDWLVAQDAMQGSVLYQHLATGSISAGGHSAGSIATFDAAADPRLVTTVHLSGGTMSPHTDLANLRHAALFVCGDTPTGAGLTTGDVANPNCEYDFENATVPVFYGMLKGASHLSTYDGIGDDTQRTQFARAIIAWLGWKLAGQQSLASTFAGSSCALCSDPAWTASGKGI